MTSDWIKALRNDGLTISTEKSIEQAGPNHVACILASKKPEGWAYKLALRPGLSPDQRQQVARETAHRVTRGPGSWQRRSDGDRQLWLTSTALDPWITGE